MKRWIFREIDDRYGKLAGVVIGLGFLIGVVLYCAAVGGVS